MRDLKSKTLTDTQCAWDRAPMCYNRQRFDLQGLRWSEP